MFGYAARSVADNAIALPVHNALAHLIRAVVTLAARTVAMLYPLIPTMPRPLSAAFQICRKGEPPEGWGKPKGLPLAPSRISRIFELSTAHRFLFLQIKGLKALRG